jgi:hypothetical protein
LQLEKRIKAYLHRKRQQRKENKKKRKKGKQNANKKLQRMKWRLVERVCGTENGKVRIDRNRPQETGKYTRIKEHRSKKSYKIFENRYREARKETIRKIT